MPGKIVDHYYSRVMRKAGLEKRFLAVDDNGETRTFCYNERGSKVPEQPSIIFIHGFASDKHAWSQVIKNIPIGFHCIAIDIPGHGETVGFDIDELRSDRIVDALKLFFDKLDMVEPMCLVGTSMGGAVVALFTIKYRTYASMICLLAPVPPGDVFETDIMRQVRSGKYRLLLPETHTEFYVAANAFSMKKLHLRRLLANGYLKSRLSMLDQHKKMLKLAFENDYPNLGHSYAELKNLQCPALIIWGRQDRLCGVEGGHFFAKSILDSELVFFEDCGHMIPNDKSDETAKTIMDFWTRHSFPVSKL